jgi:hypothetical protein
VVVWDAGWGREDGLLSTIGHHRDSAPRAICNCWRDGVIPGVRSTRARTYFPGDAVWWVWVRSTPLAGAGRAAARRSRGGAAADGGTDMARQRPPQTTEPPKTETKDEKAPGARAARRSVAARRHPAAQRGAAAGGGARGGGGGGCGRRGARNRVVAGGRTNGNGAAASAGMMISSPDHIFKLVIRAADCLRRRRRRRRRQLWGVGRWCKDTTHTRRGYPSGGSVGSSTQRPTSATRSAPWRRRALPLWVVAYGTVFRAPRSEDGLKREVIHITSHSPYSPSTRRRILTKCVAARPTLSQPTPHPEVVAGVVSMSNTRCFRAPRSGIGSKREVI